MKSNDRQFLQLCLRADWDANAQRELSRRIAAGNIDWAAVIQRASTNRISPLLYHTLRNENSVPPEFIQALQRAYAFTSRYNLYLFGELIQVLHRFGATGIPAIVLKGAALAQTVYKNPALRPLRDLDLLVRRETLSLVESILNDLGYAAPRVEPKRGTTMAFESQMLFVKSAPITSRIEIHWSLIDSPFYQANVATDWFWQTALPLRVGRVSALMLGAEAQTLYLCAHLLLHHGGDDLLWLNDIAQVTLLYREQMDWDELLRNAQEHDLVVPVQKILPMVAQEWGASIPPDILGRVSELRVHPEEARVSRWLTTHSRSAARRFWNDLWSLNDWRKQFAFALGNLFPSRAYMQQRYHIPNPLLLPLYYPYRWWLGVQTAILKRS